MNKANHNGKPDRVVEAIRNALEALKPGHPRAKIDVYRYNSVCVRVRIIDRVFRGKDLVERDEIFWPLLEHLPSRVCSEVSLVVLVTPEEAKLSGANYEFENPEPAPR